MPAYRRTWRAIGAAALVVSACKDSTAPQLSNPQQLSSNLQTVSSVFASPTFQSFGALDSAPGSPVASAPAGALLGATRVAVPQTARLAYADAPARLQAFRTAASALSSPLSAQVIPSTVWGKVYVWDVATHHYAEDVSQFDANRHGVRLILYAVDPITHHILESPLTPVGYADLLDESAGNTNQLHVIVKDGTPPGGTTYVDYTVSGTATGTPPSAFSATALGFLTDGTRRIDFNATFSATNLTTDNPDAQADVHWALDNPALTVDLHEKLETPDANNATITIDFTYAHGTATVQLKGTVTVVTSPPSVTADLAVYIDGNSTPFAVVRGTNDANHNGITITHQDGSQLTAAEWEALAQLYELPDQLEESLEHLFHPAEHFMGI